MSVKLENASYLRHDGYPVLQVDVAGRTVYFPCEAKPTLHAAGYVYIGDEFTEDGTVPLATIEVDGHPETLEGCSNDPRLWKLFDQFLRDSNSDHYQPGPVTIPD